MYLLDGPAIPFQITSTVEWINKIHPYKGTLLSNKKGTKLNESQRYTKWEEPIPKSDML